MKLILFKTGCYVICELGRAKPGEAYLCCRPSACPCTMRSRAGISGGAWRRLVKWQGWHVGSPAPCICSGVKMPREQQQVSEERGWKRAV